MDVQAIREALGNLPRTANHRPGEDVRLEEVRTPRTHRSALDPDRALVVGNRGMGKSFWAHALTDPNIRELAASEYKLPSLRQTEVLIGFNAAERVDPVAPTPEMLEDAGTKAPPETVWRGVVARAAQRLLGVASAPDLTATIAAIDSPQNYANLLTRADDELQSTGRRLVVVFDALDRLGRDPLKTRTRLEGLLRLALSTQSFRNIRIKLFLRPDQFGNRKLFEFADASKLKNTAVHLEWAAADLYGLLFQRLRAHSPAFRELEATLGGQYTDSALVVKALAGEFMGASAKRGRVYTWLPTHLADASGQTSPRTFLTAWRVAAEKGEPPERTPVDYRGLHAGVREASQDRLNELAEDYPWVKEALAPLKGQFVPLDPGALMALWAQAGTAKRIPDISQEQGTLFSLGQIPLELRPPTPESALLEALTAIGVVEVRQNGKINVPDIFRVEAGIKRRGGVKLPQRGPSS